MIHERIPRSLSEPAARPVYKIIAYFADDVSYSGQSTFSVNTESNEREIGQAEAILSLSPVLSALLLVEVFGIIFRGQSAALALPFLCLLAAYTVLVFGELGDVEITNRGEPA